MNEMKMKLSRGFKENLSYQMNDKEIDAVFYITTYTKLKLSMSSSLVENEGIS